MTHKSNIPQAWRRFENRYRIVGVHCSNCNTDYYPVRYICPKCRRKGDLEEREFSQKGTIITYSIIHTSTKDMQLQLPYVIALIKLDDGPVISAQVVECENPEIGQRVQGAFRKICEDGDTGIIQYGIKFKPL